jgi:hypothetical protein
MNILQPARCDTEPERLFGFDVTRRKILHEMCFQESGSIFHRTRGEASACSANNQLVQLSLESRAKSASTAATRSR